MNRSLFCLFVCAIIPSSIVAEELIPDLVTYDPPEFFESIKPRNDPGDSPFPMQFQRREFLAKGNSYKNFRQLNFSVRSVGVTIGEGKLVTKKPVSFAELHQLMKTTVRSDRAQNDPKIEEVQFGGRKALNLKQVVPMPQMAPGASLIFDFYWIQIDPNQVLEVKSVASNDELLKTIKDSFKTFKVIAK